MPEQGYIRDKLDLMFLILFVLNSINRPVGFDDILEMALLDESIGYFECSRRFMRWLSAGISSILTGVCYLKRQGCAGVLRQPAALQRAPACQRAVLKTSAAEAEACISCETVQNGPDNYTCSMRLSDRDG